MAHYKRKHCRYLGGTRRSSQSFVRKRWGFKPIRLPHDWWNLDMPIDKLWPTQTGYWWSSGEPRWHDIVHHTRPRRARERAMAKKAVMDRIDLDGAVWPLSRKPKVYYW